VVDLESVYRQTLAECAPEVIVRTHSDASMPRSVVAIGKCAGRMLAGVEYDRAFCVVPRGYPVEERSRVPGQAGLPVLHTLFGGHPDIDDDSFRAGDALSAFIDECDDVLFLISGGGSACVEVPLPPFTPEDVATVSKRLVSSNLPIGDINTVRKHLSALKGGRLAARVHGRSITLVYSDVSAGAISDVASGPTVADRSTNADAARILERLGGCEEVIAKLRDAPETIKRLARSNARIIADNTTLVKTAARFVERAVIIDEQVETGVEEAAAMLADRAKTLRDDEVLIAGGEPTVERHGDGKGGRCCELAVRFAMLSDHEALFGSSDGVDGSSGVAAILVDNRGPRTEDRGPRLRALLETSDSLAAAQLVGRAVMMPPTGNNLRDLFLVAGVNGTVAHH
jgi:glycerate 2-kinase